MDLQEMKQKIKELFYDAHIEDNSVILFHGSPSDSVEQIFDEGLRGGDNTTGGTHGTWEKPVLFLTPGFNVAAKYGVVLKIEIPVEKFIKMPWETLTDGLGDRVYCLETVEDDILIPAEWIEIADEETFAWY